MRIKDFHGGHNINLTKCTKMTEEEYRIHGMNGTNKSGPAAVKEESPQASDAYNLGGRLKFFKNGKFILELARAREGEKVAWVPVQKKTFWPPQGSTTSVATYRQESSTSLSVSDDNSSVQSSPWQRDHTWKQTTPIRNASHQLPFYFRNNVKRKHSCQTGWLARRPHNVLPPVPTPDSESFQCNRCVNSAIVRVKKIISLISIVEVLKNKSRQSVNCVPSPRKRILRELERVTIEDVSLKRCRGKVNQSPSAPPPQPEVNGGSEEHRAILANNCSYSIMSLLSGKQENRDDKLSSQFVAVPKNARKPLDEPAHDVVDAGGSALDFMNAGSKKCPMATGVPPGAEYPVAHSYHHPYVPPFMYSPAAVVGQGYVSSYYNSYNRGSYFPTLPMPLVRPDGLSYSWIPSYDQITREDTISDVPLNLSKHAD